ncbi:MAG: sirohydrochlorin chelatase [Chloroflexales bacterium]|nr:sirohydrochlorin chelatase [Chloroflexales bacterium]
MGHALLLAGHGSLRPGSAVAMIRIAARLRERGAAPLVAAGVLNYSRPTLDEVVRRLVGRGASAITVQPYLLVPGYFTRVALPRTLDALRAAHPAIAFDQAEPLGAHPDLAALVRQRAEAAGAGPASAVLLAAHGSPDPTANVPIHAVAAMLADADVFADVSVCYLGLNAPDIPTAFAAQVAAGVQHLVVVPYFLQLGDHVAEDVPTALAAARQALPAAQIQLAAPLGYDPLLVEVLLARAAERCQDIS